MKAIGMMFVIAASGCSINSQENRFNSVETFRLGNGEKVQRTNSRGLHLYSRGGFGIQLGKVYRELLYPGVTETGSECATDNFGQATSIASTTHDLDSALPLSRVSAVRQGIGLEISSSGIRFNFGANNRYESRTDLDRHSSRYYHSVGELDLSKTCSVIKMKGEEK